MNTILHLAPRARWETWPAGEPYLPETYAQDGFVHCTSGDPLMLRVANRFYRDMPGDFVLLTLDPALLTSALRWEAASDGMSAEPFPHIYGPIDYSSVVAVRPLLRDASGAFVGIIGERSPSVHR